MYRRRIKQRAGEYASLKPLQTLSFVWAGNAGRDCHAGHRNPIKSGIYCKPEDAVCTSPVSRSRWDLLYPLRNIDYRFDRHSGDCRYINLEGRFPLPLPLCPSPSAHLPFPRRSTQLPGENSRPRAAKNQHIQARSFAFAAAGYECRPWHSSERAIESQ